MYCSMCGAENADKNRFCLKCGAVLETKSVQPVVPQSPRPSVASAATMGGIAAIFGGAIVVIGWLMPWFAVGGGLGSLVGGLGKLVGLSLGSASGLQLFVATLAVGFAGLSGSSASSGGVIIAVVALVLTVVLIAIPVEGILIARTGIRAVERRSSYTEQDAPDIRDWLGQLRTRSMSGLIVMVVIYVLVSLIPFLNPRLGSGFLVTTGAFALTFLGALFAKSQIRPSQV